MKQSQKVSTKLMKVYEHDSNKQQFRYQLINDHKTYLLSIISTLLYVENIAIRCLVSWLFLKLLQIAD